MGRSSRNVRERKSVRSECERGNVKHLCLRCRAFLSRYHPCVKRSNITEAVITIIIFLHSLIIQNEPVTRLIPVSPTRRTHFSLHPMVFAVLRQGEVQEVQLPFQVLSANRQTCMYLKTSLLFIDTSLLNIQFRTLETLNS